MTVDLDTKDDVLNMMLTIAQRHREALCGQGAKGGDQLQQLADVDAVLKKHKCPKCKTIQVYFEGELLCPLCHSVA